MPCGDPVLRTGNFLGCYFEYFKRLIFGNRFKKEQKYSKLKIAKICYGLYMDRVHKYDDEDYKQFDNLNNDEKEPWLQIADWFSFQLREM